MKDSPKIIENKSPNMHEKIENLLLEKNIPIPKLMEGEKLVSYISCNYENLNLKNTTLIQTNYKLQILPQANNPSLLKSHAIITVGSIDSINQNMNTLSIICKDFRELKFTNCSNTAEFLKYFGEMRKVPFILQCSEIISEKKGDQFYALENEIVRQDVPVDKWRLSEVNKDYTLCPSYPKSLLVPMSIKDEDLLEIKKFRSSSRIPTMIYHHPNGASLSR